MISPTPGAALRFVDLFSGVGGFHLGLARLGYTCVLASEIDEELRDVYLANFGLEPEGDIKALTGSPERIPDHDILCAGFPCQPFSKAGSQLGYDDPVSGDLFDEVMKVVRLRQPRYIMLENVPNFERHDKRRTWVRAENALESAGYSVDKRLLSPHQFGIPQIRERLFIVAARRESGGLSAFAWPTPAVGQPAPDLRTVLDAFPAGARSLPQQVENCLKVWQDFLDQFPRDVKLPSFPIWSMEFGATYPYETTAPYVLGADALGAYRGSHGVQLSDVEASKRLLALPSYARRPQPRFPKWKVDFIRQNRELYAAHKAWIDRWLPSVLEFPASLQKFEWNCQGEQRDVWNLVVQFRASGVRVKRPTTSPSLVAMTETQVPIVAWERRYMTVRECARLQGMGSLKSLPKRTSSAFAALGNAVNSELVKMVCEALTVERSEKQGVPCDGLATQSFERHNGRRQVALV